PLTPPPPIYLFSYTTLFRSLPLRQTQLCLFPPEYQSQSYCSQQGSVKHHFYGGHCDQHPQDGCKAPDQNDKVEHQIIFNYRRDGHRKSSWDGLIQDQSSNSKYNIRNPNG